MTIDERASFRFGRLAGTVILAAALPLWGQTAPAVAAPDTPAADSWYLVTIAGQPVGSAHERVGEAGGVVTDESDLHMVLNRMGSKIEMEMGAVSREAADGRFQGLDLTMRLSTQTTSSQVTVEDGAVRIRDTAGGRTFERTVPWTGELLGPEGLRRRSLALLKKPGDTIEADTWAAEQGAVRKVSRKLVGEETVTTPGGPVHTRKIEEVTEGSPAARTLWLDADGQLVQSADPGPFGEMRTLRVDEAAARRAEAGGELPAETYGSSLVHTQVRIPHPRRVERLVLRLHHREPSLGWPAFDGPGERVLAKTADTLTLELTRPRPHGVQPFPPAAMKAPAPADGDAVYLAPNAYIQSDDPAIRAAAQSAVAGQKDVLAAGLALQRWVSQAMHFDLGIVFAPSTEIFAHRRGTCAGYAMLLTTMARAVGIPARYVLGYVYLDGIFGGHAWTEIQVGGDWLPLDAAVPAGGIADATHLGLVRSSLTEGVAGLTSGAALQMYGHLDVDVVSVKVEGLPEWIVPAGASLSTVEGDAYRNTGLGIALAKPAGFRFSALDEVWPENRLVGMTGPHGETIDLRRAAVKPGEKAETVAWQRLDELVPGGRHGETEAAGRKAFQSVGQGEAALAWTDGEDLWILAAEAPDARGLVRQVAATVKLPE
jgi:Transglutaminase-like superfamily